MNLFGFLRRPRAPAESASALLNSALDLALDFGNWLSPIQGRLKARHPSLDAQQLDRLNQTCMDAIRFGQQTALSLSRTVEPASVQGRFDALFIERYPWASQDNRERAWRHCIYYATKTARVG
ncbi:hypothetical protein [Variovorax sp. JS1663]|uniref:hypothetical protein n=1 Tax=Variovorax sp. JS1663 TaxID=1851577 RepID=UPI000B3497B7|nr:hypothetical protein [Variovorax sp. JS1663]OUM02168.1 hypothetical protein A8M77_12335 [Variovorax sp. JS1663]